MAKLDNKGFFLAETIVVVGIVATVLALFYSQISVLYSNYTRNAKYNTVESIHAVHNVKTYVSQNYNATLLTDLAASSMPLLDITNYAFDTSGYYSNLIGSLNVRKIYFSLYNINDLITNYATYDIDASFIDYLKTLKVKTEKANTYRLIIILNDGTYSNIYFPLSDLT